jgi:hypothetical protein
MSEYPKCVLCGKPNSAFFCCPKCWNKNNLTKIAKDYHEHNKITRETRTQEENDLYINFMNSQILNIIRKKKLNNI